MERTNINRVILGGLLASVVFIIIEFIFEGLINTIFNFNEVNLARQYFPDLTLNGARYQIVNILYLILTCSITIWLYASLRPKFGEGLKTAFIASLIVIMFIVLFLVNHINMGIYPLKPALISLVFSLVEFPLSIVAGASIYRPKLQTDLGKEKQ